MEIRDFIQQKRGQLFNTQDILDYFFQNLSPKEKYIIKKRYGLDGTKKITLHALGEKYGLTRERIRQIERTALEKIYELEKEQKKISDMEEIVLEILESHGGVIEKSLLLNILNHIADDAIKAKEENIEEVKSNHLQFLINKFLAHKLEELDNRPNLKPSFKLPGHDTTLWEELARELSSEVAKRDEVFKLHELIDLTRELSSYQRFSQEHERDIEFSIAQAIKNAHEDDRKTIDNNRFLYPVLVLIDQVEVNRLGYWGDCAKREIALKTINDKIHLVLEHYGEPMHFTDITEKINEIGFDRKKANSGTVHNELILDDKFVLIGRGMYGLASWGLKKGTVSDIIEDILRSSDKPLSKEEIVDRVLKQRFVKRNTINLSLLNKDKFARVGNKFAIKG
jgi:hypothetical protein